MDDGETSGRTPKNYYPDPKYKYKLGDGLARLLRRCSCVVGPEVETDALLDLVTTFVIVHCKDKRLREVIESAAKGKLG